jgi:hypothetical protein
MTRTDLQPRLRPASWALAVAALVLAFPALALAGQASSGELLFYPCKSCHPTGRAGAKLPNGFDGHQIVLEGHDALGKGGTACLVCHDSPTADPGMLKLADGSKVSVAGDVSRVCYRCHSTKYKEFRAGAHGKRKPTCTASGCHDPHTPGNIYAGPLLPIQGTGFEFQVLPERKAFRPLPPPAEAPPVETPAWIEIVAAVGFLMVGGLASSFVVERARR